MEQQGTDGTARVCILSDNRTDRLVLESCLQRAQPERFEPAVADAGRPLEALRDTCAIAIIAAYGPETEYLLRLAKREDVTVPVLVLLDEPDLTTIERLKSLGALDHLVRGQLQDELVHRTLDYAARLKAANDQILRLSSHDPVTGVLNRTGLEKHLERAINRTTRYGFRLALIYLELTPDVARENLENDVGDAVLQQHIAKRICGKVRRTDSVARLSEDTYVVLLEDAGNSATVRSVREKISRSIAEPVMTGSRLFLPEVRAGSGVFPDDGEDFTALLANARRRARTDTETPQTDDVTLDAAGQRQKALAADLHAAMRENQFEMHFQPRVALNDGRLAGVEALLRWNHPEHGMLYPEEFLPACESLGLMRSLGYQTIQHACRALQWLDEQGLGDVDVAVNLAFSQIEDEDFVDIVKKILLRNGVNAARLEFELTEATILKSPNKLKLYMEELGLMGVSFSLDDFGTGFSQLSHLAELPITALKVDTSFMRADALGTRHRAVCLSIIDLARRLQLAVITEGVETREQLEFLRENGSDQAQGFFFSPAIPLEQIPLFLASMSDTADLQSRR